MKPRDLVAALAIVVVWGINFIALKWSVAEIPPFLLTGLRYLFAALPAVFFVKKPNLPWRFIIVYATAVGILQFSFGFTALKLGLPAGLSSVISQVQVFFTMGLAAWALGERPGFPQVAGAVIGFGGVLVIALGRSAPTELLPLILMVISAFFWGASNVITKKAGKVDMFALVVWSAVVVPLPMLILSLLFEGPDPIGTTLAHLTLRGGLSVLYAGWISTLFGYGMWATLLGRYPASAVAPFTLLVPIVAITAGAVLLGETVTGLEVAGGALIFAGLMINFFGPRLLARPRPA